MEVGFFNSFLAIFYPLYIEPVFEFFLVGSAVILFFNITKTFN